MRLILNSTYNGLFRGYQLPIQLDQLALIQLLSNSLALAMRSRRAIEGEVKFYLFRRNPILVAILCKGAFELLYSQVLGGHVRHGSGVGLLSKCRGWEARRRLGSRTRLPKEAIRQKVFGAEKRVG